MKLKRLFVLFSVLVVFLFALAARGNNELGYLQIGSQSDDPFVLMKALAYKNISEEALQDRLQLQYAEVENTLLLLFSDEIDALYAMKPEIWETDEMFEERVDQEEGRLLDVIEKEMEKLKSEVLISFKQQEKLLNSYENKALANLVLPRTIVNSSLTVSSTSYDRNERLWSLSVSSTDKQVPFDRIPLSLEFSTIGDEATTRDEIIKCSEAAATSALKASVGWHYTQDIYNERFLVVVDFISITNSLTGGSYAVNLEEPILIKTYVVIGETIETLSVQERTSDPKMGTTNLWSKGHVGKVYRLSLPKDTVPLAWKVERQTIQSPSVASTSSRTVAPVANSKPARVSKDELVFRISNGAEPESLDPAFIQSASDHRIYMSLFEGLVAIDPETALAVPGVAKSWTISNDLTQYTFKLRKDALWSDGKPITAYDVVYSWLRMLAPETMSPYAWFPCMFIAGAQDFNDGRRGPATVGIRALDDHTFQMDLIGPFPYILDALTHYSFAIVPKHAIEKHGSRWTYPAYFVGNGPFTLSNRVVQTSLTAVKNPAYWDKDNVTLDKVIFYSSDSDTTDYNMYLNGELDWATNVPPGQFKAAKMRSDFQKAPQLATYYYVFQNEKAPVNNALVRKALSLAVDRQALVEGVTKTGQLPAWGIVPEMTGYEALEFPFADQDDAIAAAQKLLAKAGYPKGVGFPTITIIYNTNEAHKQIAQFIQREWKNNLGLNVTLENQEWQTYLSNRNQGNFTVARAGWVGDCADPSTFLDMFITGGGMNGGRYSNEIYDLLMNEAARMDAGPERMGILRTAEDIFINQDQGMIPLYYYVTKNMVNTDKWGGWHTNIMDYHPMKAIYLK